MQAIAEVPVEVAPQQSMPPVSMEPAPVAGPYFSSELNSYNVPLNYTPRVSLLDTMCVHVFSPHFEKF